MVDAAYSVDGTDERRFDRKRFKGILGRCKDLLKRERYHDLLVDVELKKILSITKSQHREAKAWAADEMNALVKKLKQMDLGEDRIPDIKRKVEDVSEAIARMQVSAATATHSNNIGTGGHYYYMRLPLKDSPREKESRDRRRRRSRGDDDKDEFAYMYR